MRGGQAPLLVQSRFRVMHDRDEWFTRMRAAFAVLAESTGFHRGWIGQATDDAELVTLTTQWEGIGAYRKALSRFEVKAEVIPCYLPRSMSRRHTRPLFCKKPVR